jgi:hypothetical protein
LRFQNFRLIHMQRAHLRLQLHRRLQELHDVKPWN